MAVAVFRLALGAARGRAAVGAADGRTRPRLGAAAIPGRGAWRFSLELLTATVIFDLFNANDHG